MRTSPYALAAWLMAGTAVSPAGAQPRLLVPAAPAPGEIRTTEVPGSGAIPPNPHARPTLPERGDIAFNLPATDVRVVAKAVLGDVLHVPFVVAAGVTGPVSAVTPYPIARRAVLPFFEEALWSGRFALVRQNGVYTITSADQARTLGSAGGNPDEGLGFASEIVPLHFVSGAQIKQLIDSVIPGVISAINADANTVTLAGTSGQRASARDIVSQFDVDWLRRMSFALYIPQRSDSRLIVPELDKLLNAPDSPSRSMVRLIAMDKLNGILAVTAQPQYLADVRRWIEVLDREGENNEEQLFVYRVQNGRSKDLTKTLNMAFGIGNGGGSSDNSSGQTAFSGQTGTSGQGGQGSGGGGFGGSTVTTPSGPASGGQGAGGGPPGNSGPGAGSGARRLNSTISSDDNNNAVVIFGTPHDYGIVLAALRKLDVPPYEVMIDAAITEVTLNNNTAFGVQWQFNQASASGVLTTSAGGVDLTKGPAVNLQQVTPGFTALFTHGTSVAAVLNALQLNNKINVIDAPHLLVLNNQTAALQVGDQVPILTQQATSTLVSTGGTTPIVNSVDYKDTGVILKITPRVNEGGLVMLDISQEVSSIGPQTTTGLNSPTISTRKIASTVAVQDGEVIALGGLITDSVTKTRNGIPFLSQIPILGALAGTHQTIKARTELIVLIRPHVIRTVDEAREVTDELRQKLKGIKAQFGDGAMP